MITYYWLKMLLDPMYFLAFFCYKTKLHVSYNMQFYSKRTGRMCSNMTVLMIPRAANMKTLRIRDFSPCYSFHFYRLRITYCIFFSREMASSQCSVGSFRRTS